MSNAFMTDSRITWGERRAVIKARNGGIYNNKWAKRFGHARTSQCPLCGGNDGGEHILMGCQHDTMVRMRTARHNAAARMIMAAVQDGKVGGGIISMDVGSSQHQEEDGLDAVQNRGVPEELIASLQITATSRPDAIIQTKGEDGNIRYLLLEFKFCVDHQFAAQLAQAHAQHAELMAQINKHAHCKAQLVVVLLGVTGVIYKVHTIDSLLTLGVERPAATRLASDLHRLAVQWVSKMIGTRRITESASRQRPQTVARVQGRHAHPARTGLG